MPKSSEAASAGQTAPAARLARGRKKHAAAQLASALACRAVVALTLPLAIATPVAAQVQGMPRIDLPGQGSMDPEIDPFPFDPRLEIRTYLARRLPTQWWAKEPVYNLGVFSVEIHVPENWRGNPTSALMQLCPPARHELWHYVQRIELQAFYRRALWPGVTCRP